MVVALIALIVACVGTAGAAGIGGLPGINQVKSSDIAPNAVESSDIQAKAVQSSDIEAKAVRAGDVATEAVKARQLATGAVGTAEIRANAVTGGDIREGSLDIPAAERGSDAYFDQPAAQLSVSGGPGVVTNTLSNVPAGSYAIVWSSRVVHAGTPNSERLECSLSAGQTSASYYKVRFPPNSDPNNSLIFDEAVMSGVATLGAAGNITVLCDSIDGQQIDLNQRNLFAIRLGGAIAG